MSSVAQTSGLRRARTYAPVERLQQANEDYPTGCSAFLNSIHDARYYGGILLNGANFSQETNCDIYHVRGGQAEWKEAQDETNILAYLQVRPGTGLKENFMLTRVHRNLDKKILAYCGFCKHMQDHIFNQSDHLCSSFCTIANAEKTNFGCQITLNSTVVNALLDRFQISPQYLCLLLGEPDYWAPGNFATFDSKGDLIRIGLWFLHLYPRPEPH